MEYHFKGGRKMCTSFAVYNHKNPIYGMNFDTDYIDLKLNICKYNNIDVFHFSGLVDNTYKDCAGLNSNGLFIYTQALEYSQNFKPHSDENNVFVLDLYEEGINSNVISRIMDKFIVITNLPTDGIVVKQLFKFYQ